MLGHSVTQFARERESEELLSFSYPWTVLRFLPLDSCRIKTELIAHALIMINPEKAIHVCSPMAIAVSCFKTWAF